MIDNAFSVARATCMQEHCARRNLAQQSLEQFVMLMKADITQMPYNLQNIMAALTYGKTEVLWYFWNVNEVCCMLRQSELSATQYAGYCWCHTPCLA